MKKKLLSIIIFAAIVLTLAFSFTACDLFANNGTTEPEGGEDGVNDGILDSEDGNDSNDENNAETPEDEPTAHEHAYTSVITAPSCESGGYTTYTCECGEAYVADNTEALGHAFLAYVFDENSTCVKNGTETAVCENRGCTVADTREKLDSTIAHSFTEQVISKEYFKAEATCSSGSVYYKSCVCGLVSDSETFENEDVLPHPTEEAWTFDDTYHWRSTTCECGVSVDYAEHDVDADGACTVCEKLVLPTPGIVYTLSTDETYYTVSDYTGTATGVKIADTYNSLPVKVIGAGAFADCKSLTVIEIPYGITEIAANAFSNCSALTSLVIPDSVVKMGLGALHGCSGLVEITVPFTGESRKTPTDKYQYPFGYIFGTIIYNGAVATKQAFYKGSTSTTESTTYYIPSSLEKVTVTGGELLFGAFYACEELTTVIIGDGVTAIGHRAFYNCYGLENVTIGSSVATIGSYAFYKCAKMTEIVVPDNVTAIYNGAFDGCTGLTRITLPFVGSTNDATGYEAVFGFIFGYTKNRGSNSGIEPVEGATYQYSDYSSWPTIYDYHYYIPSGLKEVFITGGTVGATDFYNCSEITTVILSDDVTNIGKEAFLHCKKLTTVVIGSGVSSLGIEAFEGCTSLTTIRFAGTVEEWNMITKNSGWNKDVPATEVICTDGTVSL